MKWSIVTAVCTAIAAVVITFAQQAAPAARAELKNASGAAVGEVTLRQTPHGVLVRASLENVPAGWHGFHVHETGKCEAPFATAGGHFNPAKAKHGAENPAGTHAGDMPNVYVPESGKTTVELLVPGLTLSDGPTSVFDADGSAIVFHEKADDYSTDPAGNAGSRLACGVVMR